MEKLKISIIVPVYNVERYLEQCLESIIDQTLAEIEIIVIDDGSTDTSGIIVDEFAKRDRRVVAVHQANRGYGAAINRGIAMAKGEYIGIIESDDFIEREMYEQLYTRALIDGADIVKGLFYKYNSALPQDRQNQLFVNPSGVDLRLAPDRSFTVVEWPQLLAFHASVWSAIYRTEFVRTIKMQETADAAYQDLPFYFETNLKAAKIAIVKQPFVHWRNDPDQTHSTSNVGKKALKMIDSCRKSYEIIQASGKYDQLKEAVAIQFVWTNVGFLENIQQAYRKQYFLELRGLLLPFKEDRTLRYTYFRKIDKVFFLLATGKSWAMMRLGLFLIGVRNKRKRKK